MIIIIDNARKSGLEPKTSNFYHMAGSELPSTLFNPHLHEM